MFNKEMKPKDFLSYLQKNIHSVVLATIDDSGKPETRIVDLVLLKDYKLYISTTKNKPFYHQLIKNPYLSIIGQEGSSTMSIKFISINGKAKDIGKKYLPEIRAKNPYLKQIPKTEEEAGDSTVFEINVKNLTAYDLSQKPIFHVYYSF